MKDKVKKKKYTVYTNDTSNTINNSNNNNDNGTSTSDFLTVDIHANNNISMIPITNNNTTNNNNEYTCNVCHNLQQEKDHLNNEINRLENKLYELKQFQLSLFMKEKQLHMIARTLGHAREEIYKQVCIINNQQNDDTTIDHTNNNDNNNNNNQNNNVSVLNSNNNDSIVNSINTIPTLFSPTRTMSNAYILSLLMQKKK